MSADARFNINTQLEHLQSKYVGTGHADTSKFEWLSNQHRDSYASFIGHHNLMMYCAIAENEPMAKVRFRMLQEMLQPCGPPVAKQEAE